MEPRLDIVVPVYNERENFETLYRHICTLVRSPWRMTVVYDFPEDTTLMVVRPLSESDQRIRLLKNDGKGALSAIKTGFHAAEAPATLLLMVDDPPEIIEKIDAMVERMRETNSAVVAASRYMVGGAHHGGSFLKGFLSRMAGLSLHFLIRLPTHDATYATKLFRTSFLHATPIESTRGFTYALELTLKAYLKDERISEVPVVWTERTQGTSRFALFGWLGSYLYWYIWGIARYLFSGVSARPQGGYL
ncbi:hypothetical protein A2673_03740 [Candidatus Kaiserbacteria bacterium RIFCSPHIGHO2_01_FULL_50_13]|uniref:Glycosyltransferase 2-like domain-containing protein n=1 Tax=Candidatus Kaiserbacteria bacterium RIFCSPLOWO2_01_FULL_50_24 TaxID=1798507 RepID=A0A1F6EIV4_9BACT|nr:MAG: hypothetical protein A2673_03740 [Candidatus Kaiserbacteria bacterium RIFCSPHIGHO2_01_FULL_50_13]OGG73573.1 MAG: hypothetical protein A3A34_02760 [Candidatus Kaiserbacteria bacterium RIFCSPLOWO2_01_FULL_50_24]OGG82196.1 MAG: hypothetical protein A3H74_03380 [Candidatus Kaiserbacteria bacterium RIFCSPLOWO2_02_FULL_51_13]